MNAIELQKIISVTDKKWAKARAQAALAVIEQWENGSIRELGEYRSQLFACASLTELDDVSDDSELKTWLHSTIDSIARNAVAK